MIIIILAMAGYMFLRSHKKAWAASIFPLMLLPFANIVFHPIGVRLARSMGAAAADGVRLAVYLAALAGVIVWVLLYSKRLPTGRSKYAYVICSIAYTVILIIIFTVKVSIGK
jgi:hypothetical protein